LVDDVFALYGGFAVITDSRTSLGATYVFLFAPTCSFIHEYEADHML